MVYDQTFQLPECPHLFLWNVSDGSMEKYIADIVRKHIRTHRDPISAAGHVKAYQQWQHAHGAAWLVEETRTYEARRRADNKKQLEEERRKADAERLAMERHRQRLQVLGKENMGVLTSGGSVARNRQTHCYNCKETLNGSIDLQCAACSWMLCECGACGCGYSRS